jgi:hypothetical protein
MAKPPPCPHPLFGIAFGTTLASFSEISHKKQSVRTTLHKLIPPVLVQQAVLIAHCSQKMKIVVAE